MTNNVRNNIIRNMIINDITNNVSKNITSDINNAVDDISKGVYLSFIGNNKNSFKTKKLTHTKNIFSVTGRF